jgi:hypothetical protein
MGGGSDRFGHAVPSQESVPLPEQLEQQIGALHEPSHRTSVRYVADDRG